MTFCERRPEHNILEKECFARSNYHINKRFVPSYTNNLRNASHVPIRILTKDVSHPIQIYVLYSNILDAIFKFYLLYSIFYMTDTGVGKSGCVVEH